MPDTAAPASPTATGYARDGYAVLPRALPDAVVAAALPAVADIVAGRYASGIAPIVYPARNGDPRALIKIDDAHVADGRLRDLATHPSVAAGVAAATGCGRVQLWASQLLVKPPGGGRLGHVGWHQDYHYWRYWAPDSELMTAWIALAEVREEHGPMRFLVGSHAWGYQEIGGDFFAEQSAESATPLAPAGAPAAQFAVLLARGGMSVHHPLLVHGSGDNRSAIPRLALALHLRGERSQPRAGATDWYVRPDRLDDGWRCPWLAAPGGGDR